MHYKYVYNALWMDASSKVLEFSIYHNSRTEGIPSDILWTEQNCFTNICFFVIALFYCFDKSVICVFVKWADG